MNKMMIGLAVLVFVAVSLIVYMRYITTNRPDTAQQYLDAQQAKRDARADRQERMERERLIIAGKPIPMTEEEAEEAEKAWLAKQRELSSRRIRLEVGAEDSVRNLLNDPDSADFKDQSGPCGYVNYKNGFGGYVGFRRYIAAGSEVAIEGENMQPSEMDKTWAKVCR